MSTDRIREHLRRALDEIVNVEKERLHQFYDKCDSERRERVAKLKPLLEALRVLSEEVGNIEGVEIDIAPHGHMATVSLRSSASLHSFSLSTSLDNRCFVVEQRDSYSFSGESSHNRHELADGDVALELLINAVGKHVAQVNVLDERRK
jgi:hypothetical protein